MAVDEQVVKLLLVEVGLLLPAVVGEVAQFPGPTQAGYRIRNGTIAIDGRNPLCRS